MFCSPPILTLHETHDAPGCCVHRDTRNFGAWRLLCASSTSFEYAVFGFADTVIHEETPNNDKLGHLAGIWTWESGSNLANVQAVSTGVGVSSPTFRPGARYQGCTATSKDGNTLYLVAGSGWVYGRSCSNFPYFLSSFAVSSTVLTMRTTQRR